MWYVLRKDQDAADEFSTLAKPFENEKEAYRYCCEQCMAFPLSTFILVQAVKEYRAKVEPPG